MNTRDPGMNSEALLIQTGDLPAWFYQALAGINYDPEHPAFKNIIMHPHVLRGLTFAKGSLNSPQGNIASSWQAQEGKFTWTIVVPPNATATIYVPAKDPQTVRESGKPAEQADGVKFLRAEGDSSVLRLARGVTILPARCEPCRAVASGTRASRVVPAGASRSEGKPGRGRYGHC